MSEQYDTKALVHRIVKLESKCEALRLNCESLAKANARLTQERDRWRSMAEKYSENS